MEVRKRNIKQVSKVFQDYNMRGVQEGEWVEEAGGEEGEGGGAEVREDNGIATLF